MYLKQKKIYTTKCFYKKSECIFSSDFETVVIDGKHYVYAIGVFWGAGTYKYFYIEKTSKKKTFIKKSYNLIKEYLDFLMLNVKKKSKSYIYFHNLKRFDGVFILDVIERYELYNTYKVDTLIRNNIIYKISINNLIFLDTMHLLNRSLNDVSLLLFNEQKYDFDITKIKSFSDCFLYKSYVLKYLFRDVELLYKIVLSLRERFNNLYNLDILKHFTISNISLNIFRGFYFDEKQFPIYITKGYSLDFIRESYMGGLCNVLVPYMEKGYYYDINSLYPYIMSISELPVGKGFFFEVTESCLPYFFGFAQCLVFIPEHLNPSPLSIKVGKFLRSYVGFLKGVWFSKEINYAVSLGCKVLKVYKFLQYPDKKVIFKPFVKDLYKKKKESDNLVDRELYKLILNSLYGRFGIKRTTEKTLFVKEEEEFIYNSICDVNNYTNSTNYRTVSLNFETAYDFFSEYEKGNINVSKENYDKIESLYRRFLLDSKSGFSSIQIASSISAYSRIYLLKEIYHQKKKGNTIFYYDTDSLFLKNKLEKKKVHMDEIGKFKLVDTIQEGIFIAPKTYLYNTNEDRVKFAFKGLDEKKSKLKKIEEYKKYLKKDHEDFFLEYDADITTKLNTLSIQSTKKIFNTDFNTEKYKKIYDKNNIWTCTEPKFIDMRDESEAFSFRKYDKEFKKKNEK